VWDRSLTRSTKLEHLHLEECDIDADALRRLLRLPQGLRSFKLSEGWRYDFRVLFQQRRSRLHGNIAPDALVSALLKYCSKSLNELSLALGYRRNSRQSILSVGQHLNLTLFDNLKSLEIDESTSDLISVRGDCDHQTYRRLPPGLEKLKCFGIPLLVGRRRPLQAPQKPHFPLAFCLATDKNKHGLPNLNTLVYSYIFTDIDERASLASSETSNESLEQIPQVSLAQTRIIDACIAALPKFAASKARLKIEAVAAPSGFIPPYLFPEKSPISEIIWDSVDPTNRPTSVAEDLMRPLYERQSEDAGSEFSDDSFDE
jgi:hypothetical protein